MNEWIDINLPWRARLDYPELNYPDMNARIKEHFGFTEEELEQKYFPGLNKEYPFITEHPIWDEYDAHRREFDEQFGYDSEKTQQALLKSDNPAIRAVLAYRATKKEINSWCEAQPEWMAACEKNDRIVKAHQEKEAQLSFCGRGLNRAGTIIEFNLNDKLVQQMIGDMNELGGVCDDCRGISDDNMILRYKVLWNGQENQTTSE